jgi:hypothetical protein
MDQGRLKMPIGGKQHAAARNRVAEIGEAVEFVVRVVGKFLSNPIVKEIPPGQMLLQSHLDVAKFPFVNETIPA